MTIVLSVVLQRRKIRMKHFIVFAFLVLSASASTEELWAKFKQDHGKTYKSLREDKLRFAVFQSNLKTIEEHNAKYEKGETSWFMGINQFTDLTDEEFKAQYLNYKPIEGFVSNGYFELPQNFSVPDKVDWREKGAVLSVKNQGQCGSCWAFSAVGAIEGQNAIKHGIKTDLSPQELVDCSGSFLNQGCDGGWMDNAFRYVQRHGLSTLSDYPYTAHDDTCKETKNSGGIKLHGLTDIRPNENSLRDAVAHTGPISVGVNADHIQRYSGGIYDDFHCSTHLDHGVLVVGYGTEGTHDFWIVKNSWGATWGEEGYIRMTRNKFNQCGIASKASYPHLA